MAAGALTVDVDAQAPRGPAPSITADPSVPRTTIRLTVNGATARVEVEDRWTLVELLRDHLGQPRAGTRSTYHKVLDREAWTHAVVSAAVVLEMDGGVCRRARVVLGGVAPIPWRLPEVDRLLTGQRITDALAAQAAEASSVTGARALSKNGYKIPLTKAMVRRTLLELASRD